MRRKPVNLVQQWAIAQHGSLAEARCEYDGMCIDLAGDAIEALKVGRIAYFDGITDPAWRYHAAVEIDGLIHDLWIDDVLPTADFLRALGGGEVSYPAEAKL